MSEFNLIEEIIKLSFSNFWDEAKTEWNLNTIYEATIPETCLCGHYPIVEVCTIKNIINQKTVNVGNCCVKKFLGLPSDRIFQAIKRIRKDNCKSVNIESLQYFFEKGWINGWEYQFSVDTIHKKILSNKQIEIRNKINNKILLQLKQANIKP